MRTNARGAAIRAEAARDVARIVDRRQSLAKLYAEWQAAPRSRDQALLRALVTGALRWHHRLAWQLEQLLARPLSPKDGELAALLRIGLLQIQELRVPDHAAVSETVAAVPRIERSHARPLVNAVLRRFLRERDVLDHRMRDVPEARWSHPSWLIDVTRSDWPAAAERILEANNERAPMTLRVNRRRTSLGEYLDVLAAANIEYRTHSDAPFAVELLAARPAAEIPGYGDGRVSIQDRSAQRAIGFLDLEDGQHVLDACAAPGGKTAHILEACDVAELVAIDDDEARLVTLRENLARLGLGATVCCADAGEPASWWDGRLFDRILLDAPCTAVGVIRRHPDIKILREPNDVVALAEAQQHLLRRLWPLLKPGGKLVYAACSYLRAESERQIHDFSNDQTDVHVIVEEQCLPGEANSDGFYYACLNRRG